ncbi:MAG TPA: hypothetical protein VHS05_16130 [Pyrinomonadaceae bacterium]|jgi:hypothetical protein|nr:hypothetical protein [Pyrinomonadaceae bacterium]
MKFIEFSHPEGGRMLAHIDHITSATYRPAEGDHKQRLGLDLDERQNVIVLFGEDAERTWNELLKHKG